jgi:Beta/Gamma crystallin
MNRCLKPVVPLIVALVAASAWANQDESAAAAVVADSQSTALSPGRITLYEYPNFAGPRVIIDSGMARNLDWANFNNPLHRAESARVESGSWRICSDAAFQGSCQVVGPGDYATLSGGLSGGIASAEPVLRPQLGAVTPPTTSQ